MRGSCDTNVIDLVPSILNVVSIRKGNSKAKGEVDSFSLCEFIWSCEHDIARICAGAVKGFNFRYFVSHRSIQYLKIFASGGARGA